MTWNIPQYDPTKDAAGYRYDPDRAGDALRFFPALLRHTTGPMTGKQFVLADWQADIVRCLFGWVSMETGLRRYRKAYIEIPRKNGKTTLAAGISLFMLLGKSSVLGESDKQCYCAAGTRDQAGILFRAASSMVQVNRKLDDRCKIRTSTHRIVTKDSFLRAIPSDGGSVHGANAWCVVGDEMHVWKDEEFYKGLVTSGGSRSEPLVMFITTAGWDRESLCWRERKYADEVRRGVISDPRFLPVIYGADETDDWEDEHVWAKANPNLGESVTLDYLRGEYTKAKNEPAYENVFRQLYLNQWTNQEKRFLDMAKWRTCPVAEPLQVGEIVWGGLDLSATTDLTALCWMADRDGQKVVEWRFWLPKERMPILAKRDGIDYPTYARQGWIQTCPGTSIDYEYVIEAIVEDAEKYKVASIGFDPYLANLLEQSLQRNAINCHQVRQTISQLSAPTKELEKIVLERRISHNNNPIAEWCADNVAIDTDANQNIRPVKRDYHSSPKKIDGIVALVCALHSFDHVPANVGSIYDQPGAMSL